MHEGYIDTEGKRKELKNVKYFGGLYRGKKIPENTVNIFGS